jgi:hypothetical protein
VSPVPLAHRRRPGYGDLSLTEKIIAEDFVAHAAPLTGTGTDQVRGREALNGWVSGIHAVLADLAFAIEVGPITDEEHMVVRTACCSSSGSASGRCPS